MSKEFLFDRHASLRDEWDFSMNTHLNPETVVPGSAKQAWWVCKVGHSWRTQVRVRANGSGCRQCYEDEVIKNNPLTLSAELAKELDDPRYAAAQISRSSTKKVWWKCGLGHRWESPVANRYYSKTGCPYCSGRFPIIGETDLATLRPDLADQWADEAHDPSEVTLSSMQKIKWKCANGHQWVTAIHNRTHSRTKGGGCPYCPGSRGRYAKVLAGVNDLATLHPEIAAELHSTHVTAQELRAYASKKLEWVCSQGHIWTAMVADRVQGSGCKLCSTAQTSKIEGRLRALIDSRDYLSDTVLDHNHKIPIPWRTRRSVSVDIYCEWKGLPVVIEYDGAFWHDREASLHRDTDKTNALLSHDYLVVRVRENTLPLLEISHPNLLQLNVAFSRGDENLEEAVEEIERWLNARK